MADTDKERLDVVKGERRLADLLNESQQRSLTIMLRRIELAAWRLEDQLTQETMPQLVLTRFTHLPGPDQQTALLQVAKHIRQEVEQFTSAYWQSLRCSGVIWRIADHTSCGDMVRSIRRQRKCSGHLSSG